MRKLTLSAVAMCAFAAHILSAQPVRAAEIVVRVPGDFANVQDAVNAVDVTILRGPTDRALIKVAPGVYNEHVLVEKSRITIQGEPPRFVFDSTVGREVLVGGTIIDGAGLTPADDHVGVRPPCTGVVEDVEFKNLGTRNARSNDANFGVDAGCGTAQRINFKNVFVELRDDNALSLARDVNGNLRLLPTNPDPFGCPNPSGGPLQFDPCSDGSAGFFEAVGVFLFGDVRDSTVEDSVVIGDDPRGNNALEGTDGKRAGFSAGFFDISGQRNTFRNNSATKVWRGIQFSGNTDGLITHNNFSETRVGIILRSATTARAFNNAAQSSGNDTRPHDFPAACLNDMVSFENRCFAGGGMWVRNSDGTPTSDSTIEGNQLVNNLGAALYWGDESMTTPNEDNIVRFNTFAATYATATCDVRIGVPPALMCANSDSDASMFDPALPGSKNIFNKNKYQ